MNWASWQIFLHYLPIIGTTISTFVLIAGLLIKSDRLKLIAIILIFFMSVLGFVVHKAEEKAEQRLENDTSMYQPAIVAHKETALPAFVMHSIAGVLSLIALALYNTRKKAFNILGTVILALSLTAAGLMSYAGYLDEKIHHVEINTVFPMSSIGAANGS